MKKYIVLGGLLITMLFSSCNLDTTPTNKVSVEQAIANLASMELALEGLYVDISIKGSYTGSNYSLLSRGLDNHLNIINDMMGGIIKPHPSDWRTDDDYLFYMHTQGTREFGRDLTLWKFCYEIIRSTNEILNAALILLPEAPTAEVEGYNELIAQLYGIRALMYHTLNTKWAFRYTAATAATVLSVPIVKAVPESTLGDEAVRNSQAEVIAFIQSDITEAIKHFALGTGNNSPYAFNSIAVNVLKARVEMYTEDYTSALATCQSIISTSGKTIMGAAKYGTGFNDATNPEWIFASNQSGDYLITWSSFMNSMATNYSTPYLPVQLDLSYLFGLNGDLDLMTDEKPYTGGLPNTIGLTMRMSDSRTDLFITDDKATIDSNMESDVNYYFDMGFIRKSPLPGTHKKFVQVANGGEADVISMRLAEVHYMAAEAAAYLGQDGVAVTNLLATIAPYDPTLTTITVVGDDLKTLIANYKAVDMFGEGKSFEDVKRRGNWVYRTEKYSKVASYGAGRQYKSVAPFITRTIPFADLLTYPIPKKAKDSNTLLDNNF